MAVLLKKWANGLGIKCQINDFERCVCFMVVWITTVH